MTLLFFQNSSSRITLYISIRKLVFTFSTIGLSYISYPNTLNISWNGNGSQLSFS